MVEQTKIKGKKGEAKEGGIEIDEAISLFC